jgi:uncharacterized protein YcfJ
MMKRYGLIRGSGLVGLLLASAAAASLYGDSSYWGHRAARGPVEHAAAVHKIGGDEEYARVIRTEPHYIQSEFPAQREECWGEPLPYQQVYHAHYQSYAPIILGGAVDGATDNQSGEGSGAAGSSGVSAAFGASPGRSVVYRQSVAHPVYVTSQRPCDKVTDNQQERLVNGYLVTYQYRGQTYTTEMNELPGDRIRVSALPDPEPGHGF